MAFADKQRFNLGCLASAIIGMVMLPPIFGGLMFGGGGCEGDPSPCQPNYIHVWIIMGLLFLGLIALAWLINRVIVAIHAFRSERRRGEEHMK